MYEALYRCTRAETTSRLNSIRDITFDRIFETPTLDPQGRKVMVGSRDVIYNLKSFLRW